MKSRAHRYRYVRHVAMSCFPDGGAAPPTLSYASPQSWTYGAAITPLSPTTTGATSFAVTTGALPTGVTLHPTTGVISGTPTLSKVAANVTIRATGPGGTADAVVNIAVPSPLYTSLVDYWNLDEASGSRAGSYATLDLTDNNTVTQAAGVGGTGNSAQFTNANSESLTRASEAALQTGAIDFTVAAWVYIDTDAPGTMAIVGKYGGAYEFMIYRNANTATKFQFYVADGQAEFSGSTPTGAWHFVVGEYATSTKTLSIAVNNAAAVTANSTVNPTAAAGDFAIGRAGSVAVQFLSGRVQAVGYWKRTLTSNEKTWLYNTAAAARLYSALATYDGG